MYAKERRARPLETTVGMLSDDRRAFQTIKDNLLYSSMGVRMELDPEGLLAGKCQEQINVLDQRIESRAGALANERRQFVQTEREKDEWASPSGDGGWLCPKSPTGVCTYEDPEDHMNDTCDHCGFPEERK